MAILGILTKKYNFNIFAYFVQRAQVILHFFFNPTTTSVIAETVRIRTQADQWAPGGGYSIPGKSDFTFWRLH